MAESIEWRADGTPEGSPFSRRFNDRYRSEQGGVEQARAVFLQGCGLPGLWAGQPQWCIVENGFGFGLNFLVTWQAWKADAKRPRLLHFVSTEAYPVNGADLLRAAAAQPELLPLARHLKEQFWGLLPGVHRLVFEDGRVLLTLLVGDAKTTLGKQNLRADSLYLDGFSPDRNPQMWDLQTCKALARCCRRGARLATWTVARSVRDALTQSGFTVQKAPGVAPKRDSLQGEFNPAWPLRTRASPDAVRRPARCVVIGAGLAGAAVAASLARRGWSVVVLDAAEVAASGASSLPAGVLAAHVSPDDSVLSRLSRHGVRATLQQAEARLQAGRDWQATGVLERSLGDSPRCPPAAWLTGSGRPDDCGIASAAADWLSPASAAQLAACRLDPSEPAHWHARAGWVKPAALVRCWLATPGIQFRGRSQVASISRLRPCAADQGAGPVWQVQDRAGNGLATAELVVLAAGWASGALAETAETAEAAHLAELAAVDAAGARDSAIAALGGAARSLALQAVRGQVLWGLHAATSPDRAFPPFPVNGLGSLIAALPMSDLSGAGTCQGWLYGATYQRAVADCALRAEDDDTNKSQLRALLPELAATILRNADSASAPLQSLQAWAGVRCATPTRLPALGPLQVQTGTGEQPIAGVWVCTAMGSRGLTFAALCAEVLCAQLHGEPMPIEDRLVRALLPRYQSTSAASAASAATLAATAAAIKQVPEGAAVQTRSGAE